MAELWIRTVRHTITADLDSGLDQLWLSGEDSVDTDGPTGDVRNFLARAQDWPQRPGIRRLLPSPSSGR